MTIALQRDPFGTVLERLGLAICGGRLAPGTLLSIDDIADADRVARSVVREALRVLASKGLVSSKRGVGTTTLPAAEWNLFDPSIVRWRLATDDRLAQLRSLCELRNAIEPEAAALAAVRATPAEASALVALAARLWAAGEGADLDEFVTVDIEFHRRLLAASGNDMFAHFAPVIEGVLVTRAEQGLTLHRAAHAAIENHMSVARAIQKRDADAARASARCIATDSLAESQDLWTSHVATTA